jgi:hypothetical protein
MNASFIGTYYGAEFDSSCYASIEEFAAAVWEQIFHDRDGVDSTENAIRWANEAQARAEHDWKREN